MSTTSHHPIIPHSVISTAADSMEKENLKESPRLNRWDSISYVMSDDAKWALHTFENAQTPPVISLVEVKSHKVIRVMEDNQAHQREAMLHWVFSPKEFFRVDIGEVILDAWMIKPPGF